MININQLSNKSFPLPPKKRKSPASQPYYSPWEYGKYETQEEIDDRRLPGDDLYLPPGVN